MDKSKIIIQPSKTADTRTCDFTQVDKQQLLDSSTQHIGDVQQGMNFLADTLSEKGKYHDWTKIDFIDEFHSDFKNGFKDSEWWVKHQKLERHHLKDPQYIQEDVNLLDILEMIVDGAMAGLARSGKYREEEIPNLEELLVKAYRNTIKLMINTIEVEKDS